MGRVLTEDGAAYLGRYTILIWRVLGMTVQPLVGDSVSANIPDATVTVRVMATAEPLGHRMELPLAVAIARLVQFGVNPYANK